MEFHTLILSGALMLVLMLFAVKHGASRRRYVAMMDRLPGPRATLIIGNLGDMLWVPRNRLLDVVKQYVERYDGFFRTWNGPIGMIHLSRPEHLEVILNNSNQITKSWTYDFLHPWLGTGLLTSTGSKWHAHRKLITPTFHFKILETFFDVFVEQSEVLVGKLRHKVAESGDKGFNIYPLITLCTLDIICETAMGVRVQAQGKADTEYIQAIYDISEVTFERTMRPWIHNDFIFTKLTNYGKKTKHCIKILHSFTNRVIQERKVELLQTCEKIENTETEFTTGGAKKRMAFLDLLLQANVEGTSLTDEEIREEVDTFMFEGHDTTTAAISWTLFLLGLHPDIQTKVREELDSIFQGTDRPMTMQDCQELKYLERVIKETLRLYPSVPFVMRTLNGDTKCGDHVLPNGATIALHFYFTHRDERHFPDPETFDPDRFLPEHVQGRHPYAYVPFSAGPRNCIGQKFAMLEEKVMLATILRHFKVRSLETRANLRSKIELIMRPESGVRVDLTVR